MTDRPIDPNAAISPARTSYAIGLQRLAIHAVPTNWLDPLLTGPDAVIGTPPYGNEDIERLLLAVRDRIAAAIVSPSPTDPPGR